MITARAVSAPELNRTEMPDAWDSPMMIGALIDELARDPGDVGPIIYKINTDKSGKKLDHSTGRFHVGRFESATRWKAVYEVHVGGLSINEAKREAWAWIVMRKLAPKLRPVLRAIAENGAKDFVVLSRADYERLVDRAGIDPEKAP